MHSETVDGIPLIYQRPSGPDRNKLVLLLSGFSGNKKDLQPRIEQLADLGYTALSFDAYQHGARMIADVDELRARIRGNIRRYFWPNPAGRRDD